MHGIEHVEQRQVAIQRQAVPGWCADFTERNVCLAAIDEAHLAGKANERAHQPVARTFVGQVFDERQQRLFAVIEADEIEEIEDARLGELAQLGIHIAAAEHNARLRSHAPDRLGDAKGPVDRAGERHGNQHQVGLVLFHDCEGQLMQCAVDEVGRSTKRFCQRLETGLAERQCFGVADEFEAWIDGFAQDVGDVVKVERCQMAGAILHAEGAECPGQRVAAVRIDIDVERRKTRPLGQEAAASDPMGEAWVVALEKTDGAADSGQVVLATFLKRARQRPSLLLRQCRDGSEELPQSDRRKQPQHQRQGEIVLPGIDVARAEKTREVGRRWVGNVELRHRRHE